MQKLSAVLITDATLFSLNEVCFGLWCGVISHAKATEKTWFAISKTQIQQVSLNAYRLKYIFIMGMFMV